MSSSKPNLQKRIFWDVDFERIDFDEKYRFVIERVFERGDVADIRAIRGFYGDTKIVEALIEAKFLFYETFVFVKNLFQLKETDFRCYRLNHSRGLPWGY